MRTPKGLKRAYKAATEPVQKVSLLAHIGHDIIFCLLIEALHEPWHWKFNLHTELFVLAFLFLGWLVWEQRLHSDS